MSYPWNSAQLTAIAELAKYNGGVYNATSNPYGFAGGGHYTIFTPSLNYASTAANAIKDAADFAGAKADAAASSASDAGAAAAKLSGTSTTAVALGLGTKSFTTQAGKFFDPGRTVRIVSAANPNSAYMIGKVTAYSGTALSVNVLLFVGTGSPADWQIFVDGELGPSGTLTINSVTSLAPDKAPTVVNNGTASAASLDIGIPRGMPAGLYFKWSTNNAATDPTTGRVKASSSSLTDATSLYISEIDANGVPQSATIGTWDDSTSPVRGQIRIEDIANPANFVVFNIVGTLVDNGAWDTLSVLFVDKGGTLVDGASVRLGVRETGDKGTDGAPGAPGAAASVSVGTVTTGAAGSSAAVTNSGSTAAATLNFTIPRGNTGAVGPVIACRYNFDTSITDADPADGTVRFNAATISSVTQIFLDNVEAVAGASLTAFIDTFGASTNPSVKGILTFKDINDPSKFVVFAVNAAVTVATGYRKIPVTYQAGTGGFTAAAQLGMMFERAGDKGSDGGGAGNVVGPASATDGSFALYDGTTGKLIKAGGTPGALATKSSVGDGDFSAAGGQQLSVAKGGTGATTASTARDNLGLTIGSNVQSYSAKLAAIDGMTWAANTAPYYTSATQVGTYSLTALGRSLAGSTDAAAAQTTLQLRPGVDIQAYHANLAALASLAGTANRIPYFTGAGAMALAIYGNSANGIPILDANGKLLASTLPALAISDTFVVASQSAMLAVTAERGDVAVRTDLNKSYILKADDPTVLGNWQELLTPTDVVQSVAGLQGVITAAQLQTALGLGSLAYLSTIQTANITDDAVTNAKLANMANLTFKGRLTTGTGDPEDLTASQVSTALGVPAKAAGTDVRTLTDDAKFLTAKSLADAMAFTTPTYAASFAPDWSANGFNQSLVATANTTLTGPFTGGKDGEPVVIEYVQDATGSRTLAFNTTYFKIPPALTITASTAANAKDKLYGQLRLRSGTLVCEVTGFDKGVP